MLEHLNSGARMPQRVVILGAQGFVGRASARLLAAQGVPVLPLGRAEADLLAAGTANRLSQELRPDDAVVVISARAPCKDAAMLVDNVRMMECVCQALAPASVSHVIYISSDAVYRDSRTPLTEESCAEPNSLHGAMHLAREVMLKSALTAPLAILRPTLLYGAADPHNGYGPNRFRRLAAAGQEIVLFGEGEEQRDHVLIDDVGCSTWRPEACTASATSPNESRRCTTRPCPCGAPRGKARCRTAAIAHSTAPRLSKRSPIFAIRISRRVWPRPRPNNLGKCSNPAGISGRSTERELVAGWRAWPRSPVAFALEPL